MATTTATPMTDWIAADLVARFGPIPLHRIRFDPPPGTATEADVLAIHDHENRLFELVDGTLVEKTKVLRESVIAVEIGRRIGNYLEVHDLGVVAGADDMMRLAPGLVRIPDVAYLSYDRFPGGRMTDEPIPVVAPDLAIEVLSPWNTRAEMDRKLREYFAAGTRLVWYFEPEEKRVKVYTTPDPEQPRVFREGDVLDGGEVLPGFALPVSEVFGERAAARPRPPG